MEMENVDNKRKLILLVGASGSGKTTVAHRLAELYRFKELQSYTTRKPRYEGETGHIFATEADYRRVKPCDMIAYTNFCGNHYWATRQQADEADVYVIDPKGVEYFKEHYKGGREFVSIFLVTDEGTRTRRMKARGDSPEEIQKRIENDRVEFASELNAFQELEFGFNDRHAYGLLHKGKTYTYGAFDYYINNCMDISLDVVCDTINEIAEGM